MALKYLTIFVIVTLLSSVIAISFHSHHHEEEADHCSLCAFQQTLSSSSVSIDSNVHVFILPGIQHISLIIKNDTASDPSQKTVCSSHAPPQYS